VNSTNNSSFLITFNEISSFLSKDVLFRASYSFLGSS
jgi:hypothetical protein